jgi:outer membrane receptor protein involved in Fe transport
VGNVSGGNPNLSQEKSETITFGTVITPEFVPGLALSVDWFSIGINGAIAQLGGGLVNTGSLCYTTLQDANSIYCRAFNRDPGNGAIVAPRYVQVNNANTGAAKTQGIDFSAQDNFGLDWGYQSNASDVSVSTNWTWTTEFTLTPVKELSNLKNECVGSFGPTCGSPIPALKGITRVTWTDDNVSVSLRHRFVGGTMDDRYNLPFRKAAVTPALNTLTNPIIPDFHYFDISGTYDLTDEVRLGAGINNVFNIGPPIVGGAANGNVTFPATYDPLGQSFFFDVTFRTN